MTVRDFLHNEVQVAVSDMMETAEFLRTQNAAGEISDADAARLLEEQVQFVKSNLEKMYAQALIQKRKCEKQYEQYYNEGLRLTAEQTEIFGKLETSRNISRSLNSTIVRLQAELESIRRGIDEISREASYLDEEKQRAIEKNRKKKEELAKWFWVPGYGLYLSIDYLTDDLDSKCRQLRQKMADLYKKRDLYVQKAEENRLEYDRINRQIQEQEETVSCIEKQQEEVTGMLNASKRQMLEWEDLTMQLDGLMTKLQAGQLAPDVLMEVLDMLEGIGDAA